jgi:tRNA nucleotidyltransferase (CCA-adding enzyme)
MSVTPQLPTIEPDSNWEHFPHDADIGVRGYGSDVAIAFENVARAMTAVMLDPAEVRPNQRIHITCEAPDQEILLVDWLNALIFEIMSRLKTVGLRRKQGGKR